MHRHRLKHQTASGRWSATSGLPQSARALLPDTRCNHALHFGRSRGQRAHQKHNRYQPDQIHTGHHPILICHHRSPSIAAIPAAKTQHCAVLLISITAREAKILMERISL
jgi:hypothetical protein